MQQYDNTLLLYCNSYHELFQDLCNYVLGFDCIRYKLQT